MTPRPGGLGGYRVEPRTEMGTGRGVRAVGCMVLVPSGRVRLEV